MFEDIISVENLLLAWNEFVRGKRAKFDVQEFELHLMDNIFKLHRDLTNRTYRHGRYQAFNIADPKPRNIHKAFVRDRLVHHAIYRVLYLHFDRTFIADSFSCRNGKGTHKALERFRRFTYRVSKNSTRTCWGLKCDIKKFFANIDHAILLRILEQRLFDSRVIWLCRRIIESFETGSGKGLPLGNLTSQLFVNVYMDMFDKYVKHDLREIYYIRYADDIVIFSQNRIHLESVFAELESFLQERLSLQFHPDKVFIKTLVSGVDFLGWVHFSDHRVLRTSTKRRMMRRVRERSNEQILTSYLGLLKHGNTFGLQKELLSF